MWKRCQQQCARSSALLRRRTVSTVIISGNSKHPQEAAQSHGRYVVSTRSRHRISSSRHSDVRKGRKFSIPLTVSDAHLRHEQLPFAYYFEEELDQKLLKSSLRRVLKHFPVVSGKINPAAFRAIDCCPSDSIPLSFGDMNMPLEKWLRKTRGHSYVAGTGHPVLLPLFDPLFENNDKNNNSDLVSLPYDNLLKIRVTYFECGGTALGVNFLHALGDTASCVRFVQCWGREMQRLSYPRGACNVRASANVSGMMTEELAELMGLSEEFQRSQPLMADQDSWFCSPSFLDWFSSKEETQAVPEDHSDKEANHQYLQLSFPEQVLTAMKDVASGTDSGDRSGDFVSTNDMVTSFGWLLKRALSGDHSWNISMVVNLRGRCGVDSFTDLDDSSFGDGEPAKQKDDNVEGLFGNGITNIVAMHPPTSCGFNVLDVTRAARSIRAALQDGISQLPERLIQSRMGKSSQQVSTANSFPTTSWSQFKLKDISFSGNTSLAAFHGDPSHPLPRGQSTYSSVILKSPWRHLDSTKGSHGKSGVKLNLLLPSDKVEVARQKHLDICEAFLDAQVLPSNSLDAVL